MSVLQLAARKIIPQFFDRTFSEAEVPGEATLMRLLKALQSLFLLSPFLFSQTSPHHGIDVTDLDRKVDPCNDFYEFANGSWRANHPIPPTMVRWSRRWESGETTKDKLKEVLEAVQLGKNASKGSTDQIIGDYYGACMDETRVNARGIEPLKKRFAQIDAVKDSAGLQPVLSDLHDVLITVPFNLSASTDPHKPTWVLADLGASGYALPDRDYYLKPDARFSPSQRQAGSGREHWRPRRREDCISCLPEVARRQAAPSGHRRLHAGTAILHCLGTMARRCHPYRGAKGHDAIGSAPHRQISRRRATVKFAGVPEGLQLQGRCADGAGSGQAL